jgi:dipeptidyl aminopeptidase/acylaminoacyl peptidase
MKHKRPILMSMLTVLALLTAGISYAITHDDDAYKYFTGLGNGIAISTDDQQLAFSYYQEGSEAIFTARLDGTDVKKITHPNQQRHRNPKFSPDGSKLLYLSQNTDDIQSLYLANTDGTNPTKLTDDSDHVSEAIFSEDGKKIYFVSMPSSEIKKAEGETKEGRDLYSIGIDGSGRKQLTDKDYFSMESLVLSADGSEIHFKDYMDIYFYDLEDGGVYVSDLSKDLPAEPFYLTLSPQLNAIAFTAAFKESEDSSLYEYELHWKDLKNSETKVLTNLKTSVVSPVFYHQSNKLLFLEHKNWSDTPEKYLVYRVDVNTGKLQQIHLDLPETKEEHQLMKTIDLAINGWTIGFLYTLFLVLAALYLGPAKLFLPSLVSLGLGILGMVGSFIVAATFNPWAGIAVGMVSAGLLACTLISFIIAFSLRFFKKKTQS